jgi:hypothetical protein
MQHQVRVNASFGDPFPDDLLGPIAGRIIDDDQLHWNGLTHHAVEALPNEGGMVVTGYDRGHLSAGVRGPGHAPGAGLARGSAGVAHPQELQQ